MAAVNFKTLSNVAINQFFNSFDTVLTDCDGVLWMHTVPIQNAAEVLKTFSNVNKSVFYVTNNSKKTRKQFVEKCKALNFIATEDNILCTANLAACWLVDQGFRKKAYVIGSEAITKELDLVGISNFGVGPDLFNPDNPCLNFQKDPDVGAVIVGFDGHFSYPKMVKAATYLKDPMVHFVGTNTDEKFPVSSNIAIPGTGTLLRCVEICAERKATIMGKPESYIADVLIKRYNVNPKRTLMIGDRCNTDILLGTRCGFITLLVLTGVTDLKKVHEWKNSQLQEERDLVPNYYIDSIGDLLPYLKNFECTFVQAS